MSTRRAVPRRPAVTPRLVIGLSLYVTLAFVVLAFDLDSAVPLRPLVAGWMVLAAAPVVYLALAAAALGGTAPGRVPLVLGISVVTHAGLIAATAGLSMLLDAPTFEVGLERTLWRLPLIGILQIACVAFMMWAVARRLAPVPRPAARTPRPVTRHLPPEREPVPAKADEDLLAAGDAAGQLGDELGEAEAASVPSGPSAAVERVEPRRPAAAAGGNLQPAEPDGRRRPSAERVEAMVRIPFARVADQFPAGTFLLPPDRVAANLLEPEHLLVPLRLVAPQLVEGHVQIAWDVVADQFPRQAFAVPEAEIARRLPGERLVLPLDEVVKQIPPDAFALTSPTVDIRGLEDFPPPFQPHVPAGDETPPPSDAEAAPAPADAFEPASEPRVDARRLAPDPGGRPRFAEEASEQAPAASADPSLIRFDGETSVHEAPGDLDVVAQSEPEPAALAGDPAGLDGFAGTADGFEATGDGFGGTAVEPVSLDSEPYPVDEELSLEYTPEPEPDERALHGPASFHEPGESRWATEVEAPARRRRVELAEVRALLSPLVSPLELDERFERGYTFVTASSPAVNVDAAVSTALPFVPFLGDPRMGGPVSQATVRADAGWLVLTPIEGVRGDAVLLTAVPPGAPLAMVERASLRAARGDRADDDVALPRMSGGGHDPDLRPDAVPPTVLAVAESLRAFGPVKPAVVRDRAGTLAIYLFAPAGADAGALAGLARDVRRHFADTELGSVASVVFRLGSHRLVIWELEAGRACPTVLVASGPVDRPGLARIELERAALRLAAL